MEILLFHPEGWVASGFGHILPDDDLDEYLSQLSEHACATAATDGLDLCEFEIALIDHDRECTGCPDSFGLQDGCREVETYTVTEVG